MPSQSLEKRNRRQTIIDKQKFAQNMPNPLPAQIGIIIPRRRYYLFIKMVGQ